MVSAELITQSPLLTGAAILLIVAIGLTVMRGLMNIAKKLAVVGAVILALIAGFKMIFPGVIPFLLIGI